MMKRQSYKDKLGGVIMVGQNKLKSYFDKISEEEEEGIHVFIVSTSTGKCLPTFYLSNKKFAVTKYRFGLTHEFLLFI